MTKPPELSDYERAALTWMLWHHQGGNSPVGQPIRTMLGMGDDDHMTPKQCAKRYADSLAAGQQGKGEERELAIHRHDCSKFRDFWSKYALGQMMPPSCLKCGQVKEDRAITHLELPDIYICTDCATSPAPLAEDRVQQISDIVKTEFGIGISPHIIRLIARELKAST